MIHSAGEGRLKAILEGRFEKTVLQVCGPHVRMSSVIEKEPTDHLPEELFQFFVKAEFDFVVAERRPPSRSVLAIEFDEPQHETDTQKARNDRLKNRICGMAELPLLRVRYPEIDPLFKRDSLLSYIVDVVLRYKSQHESKDYSLPENLRVLSEEAIDEIDRRELAEIWRLEDQLAKRYSAFRDLRANPGNPPQFAFQFALGNSYGGFSETEDLYEGALTLRHFVPNCGPDEWPVVHRVSDALTLITRYRTTKDPRPPWPSGPNDLQAMKKYVDWIQSNPCYSPNLPGVNWLCIAWNVLEALCLRQLLRDFETGNVPSDREK